MPLSVNQVLEATRGWPRTQVAELVDRLAVELHGGVAPEIETAWKEETRRRVGEIESGKAEFIPGEQVLAELRKITGR